MLSELASTLLPRCTFPKPGEPIDCAVSGGSDSLALLVLAAAAGCRVTAYHVDHKLRPTSASEAEIVESAARYVGASFVALEADFPAGPNLEARARAARFSVLPKGAATGHTADDQAETILLNLMRGAGIDGLRGMRSGVTHPILGLRRIEAFELVSSLRLSFVDDESNRDLAYRRNRVRHEVLPLLSSIAERDLVPILCRQAELLDAEASFLDVLAAGLDPADAKSLRDAPAPLARRALRAYLREASGTPYAPDAAAIARVLDVARGLIRATEIAGGQTISRSKGRLIAKAP